MQSDLAEAFCCDCDGDDDTPRYYEGAEEGEEKRQVKVERLLCGCLLEVKVT